MIEAADGIPVTVKCRIGIDDQDPEIALPDFIDKVAAVGVNVFVIHARKAWLQGLSPKQNRDIPPLDYPLARAMKAGRPDLSISINGGIETLAQAEAFLADGFDGVMIGRAAYHDVASVLIGADAQIFDDDGPQRSAEQAVRDMLPYIDAHLVQGGRLNQITRHMLGLFQGRPGARQWRRTLSEEAHRSGADTRVVEKALSAVTPAASVAA
jgi:tRNA-dihydrouridine synthase A